MFICLSGPAASLPILLVTADNTGKTFFLVVCADGFWTNDVILNNYLNSEFFAQFQTAA